MGGTRVAGNKREEQAEKGMAKEELVSQDIKGRKNW